MQFAGTYQSIPGGLEEAQYLEFSTGTLGRAYGTSVVAPFREFQIVEPGSLRLDRINQFDFRISKIFKSGKTKTIINFDLYNLFNDGASRRRTYLRVRPRAQVAVPGGSRST